jgi:hypothetical protein
MGSSDDFVCCAWRRELLHAALYWSQRHCNGRQQQLGRDWRERESVVSNCFSRFVFVGAPCRVGSSKFQHHLLVLGRGMHEISSCANQTAVTTAFIEMHRSTQHPTQKSDNDVFFCLSAKMQRISCVLQLTHAFAPCISRSLDRRYLIQLSPTEAVRDAINALMLMPPKAQHA